MKVGKYLLFILSFILLVVNFFRVYILIWGWKKLGRMPEFIDGAKILKPIFISWQTDENLLLAAHFLTILLILIMIPIVIKEILKPYRKIWLTYPILIIFFEVLLRSTTGYDYIMFD